MTAAQLFGKRHRISIAPPRNDNLKFDPGHEIPRTFFSQPQKTFPEELGLVLASL